MKSSVAFTSMLFGAFAAVIVSASSRSNAQSRIQAEKDPRIVEGWTVERLVYDTGAPWVGKVKIRAGFLAESPNAKVFKGNILYLEGLGDSMMNHQEMFKALSDEGYRVISFDYMGQGGSSGAMNNTKFQTLPAFRRLEIRTLANVVYRRYARTDVTKKLVIGWSSGGLAALQMAKDKWADAVVLIAPGLHPQLVPGDSFAINVDTLACRTYPRGTSPHIDPVRPSNALKVPLFAMNLLETSVYAKSWKVDPKIKGLVFLGGEDHYVNTPKIPGALKRIAPQFQTLYYAKACHEIHNSHDQIRNDLVKRTIEFFNGI